MDRSVEVHACAERVVIRQDGVAVDHGSAQPPDAAL